MKVERKLWPMLIRTSPIPLPGVIPTVDTNDYSNNAWRESRESPIAGQRICRWMAGGRGCGCCYASTSKRDQSDAFCTECVCIAYLCVCVWPSVDKSMATPLRTGAARQSKTKTPTCELYLPLEIRKIFSRELSPDNCCPEKLEVWLTRSPFLSREMRIVSHRAAWIFCCLCKDASVDSLDRLVSIRDVVESSFRITGPRVCVTSPTRSNHDFVARAGTPIF